MFSFGKCLENNYPMGENKDAKVHAWRELLSSLICLEVFQTTFRRNKWTHSSTEHKIQRFVNVHSSVVTNVPFLWGMFIIGKGMHLW